MTRRLLYLFILLFLIYAAMGEEAAFSAETPNQADTEQAERDLVTAARSMRSSGSVQFNFRDLDVIQFIRFMSELLGENIIVSPGVGGSVSVVSPKPISVSESRLVMLSALEMNGLSLQNMGSYSKVVPGNAGPSTNNEVVTGRASFEPGEQLVVQITPLQYVKAGYVIDPIKLGVPGVNMVPISGGSSVLLTGRAVLLKRAVGIIKALDVPDSIRAVKVVQLDNASARVIEGHLNALAKEATSRLASLIAIGDERSGKVILVGTKNSLEEAEKLLSELDVPATSSNFHVYRLQNADASSVAEQLGQILAAAARLQLPRGGGAQQQGGQAAQPMAASVVPDVPTNSLVLTATQEQYAAIKGIIEELDIQPKQVLLRGLIAEINLTKLNSAGIDWSAWGGDASNNLLVGGSAQLGSGGLPAQFMEWFTEMTRTEEVHYDSHGNAVTTTNIQGMGLIYAYIKMLNQYNAINVLSMPRLMCTDNMASALQVGQVIPQLKGSLSDVTNPAAMQNSYEYKDTGLILKVTPHIRSGNLVALDIEQTIEDVLSTPGVTTPVTSKRLIKTNVMVANNETIILGGLIREVERTLKNRVPGISYIPIIGNIFTSNERQREKVDLMVFLTPRIIETPSQATEATIEVTTGGDGLSPGERETIMRYYDEFTKSTSKESVSHDIMRLRKEILMDAVSADNAGR
ncbi:MAG: type II secretion system secretin GspD [Synergistaceae bacterium]|jgi:general secretion pathway protein D|nr:type II secretion system secretin GspD [Synergistaceae bacterium]